MATGLIGGPELRRRLEAIKTTFKPVGQKWSRNTKSAAISHTPVRTGRLRKSYRIRTTNTTSTVRAHFTAYFVDKGPKPHDIKPRKAPVLAFTKGGQTIFARKVSHPGYRARPYRDKSAIEGMRQTSMADELVGLWNGAA